MKAWSNFFFFTFTNWILNALLSVDMTRRPMVNESPDGRPMEVEPWETEQIPCVHFVNYNTDECLDFNSGAASSDEASSWTEMNIEETMAVLTRCSFDEAHRQPIFNLGGIPALAELIQVRKSTIFQRCKTTTFFWCIGWTWCPSGFRGCQWCCDLEVTMHRSATLRRRCTDESDIWQRAYQELFMFFHGLCSHHGSTTGFMFVREFA